MTEVLTKEQFKAIQAKPKRSKYGAKRCELDGFKFASQRERDCYAALKVRERAGEIRYIKLQERFPLHVDGAEIGVYVADFVYLDAARTLHVLDAKGFKTPLYRWKKRHMEAEYEVTIEEV